MKVERVTNDDFGPGEESIRIKASKKAKNKSNNSNFIDALELINTEIPFTAKLLDPYLQRVGLASVVGSSDTGKSTFLRQLAISIALGKKEFLNLKLHPKTNKVIYVSSEDDRYSTKDAIDKQLKTLLAGSKKEDLKNLSFVFETEDLYSKLKKRLKDNPVDLIVIDAFADIFSKEINSNTAVRSFLMKYHRLAIANECLIIFLHHNSKRSDHFAPSKDNIIGSQAYESKMRCVLEIRGTKGIKRDLILLKCNFLPSSLKQEIITLELNENLVFEYKEKKKFITKNTYTPKGNKADNPEIISKVIELYKKKLSYRKIEKELKGTKLAVSKSVAQKIGEKHKDKIKQIIPKKK